MIFFSFHIGDWESGTKLLSPMEKGIYIELLTLYYKQEAPIMQMQCKRIARAYDEQEKEALQYVLDTFFMLDGDCYRNNRADDEIKKMQSVSEERRNAAKARWGKASKSKKDANACANALQMDMQTGVQSECKRDAIQYPISNKDINTNKHISLNRGEGEASAPVDVCDEFENPFCEEPPFDFDADGQIFDAPIGQLIDDSNLRNNEKALQNDNHVLTASQMIVLAKTLGTSLGHSARLDEIASRKTLTVSMVKKVIEDWKATRTGTGYLIGYLDNVSANPSQLNGKRKDREVNAETISNGQAYAFAKKLGANHAFASVNAHAGEDMQPFVERVAEKLKDNDYFEYCRPFLIKLGCIKEVQA